MLTEWNRLSFQIVGVLFAGFAVYGIYVLLGDVLTKWTLITQSVKSVLVQGRRRVSWPIPLRASLQNHQNWFC